MPRVTADKIDGAAYTIDASGKRIVRTFDVDELDRSPADRLIQAYEAVDDVDASIFVPSYGDVHPTETGLVATNIRIAPNGKDGARVTVEYRTPTPGQLPPKTDDDTDDPGLLEVGGAIVEREVQVDKDGNPLLLVRESGQQQQAKARIQVPDPVLRRTRKETTNPASKQAAYQGKVNSVAVWGRAERTLLCRTLSGQSDDNGATYTVTYEFQYNPDTWDVTLAFLGEDGLVAPGALPGDGIESFQVYQEADFNALPIWFPIP